MLGLAGPVETIGPAAVLRWIHSVQKTRWTEEWRAEPDGLHLVAASAESNGAGMEPPEGAVLRDGAWHWAPRLPPLPEVILGNAGVTAPWELCPAGGACRALLAPPGEPIRLFACTAPQ